MNIRVVNTRGFALDLGCIVLRNIFRIIDNYPMLWLVPILSRKSQRLGDMASGTLVVRDKVKKVSPVREWLLKRNSGEMSFYFDTIALEKATETDIQAMEKLLERWNKMDAKQKTALVHKICTSLVQRMDMDPPPKDSEVEFVKDFLSQYYGRQYRNLG